MSSFLMFMSKEQILTLKPVYTGNPLSPANIYVGSPLVLSTVKKSNIYNSSSNPVRTSLEEYRKEKKMVTMCFNINF